MKSQTKEYLEAVIILDTQDCIVGVNTPGEVLLKIKQSDLLGKSVNELFPSQSTKAYRNELLTPGRKEVSISRGDGKTIYAELSVSMLHGNEGNKSGRVLIIQDRNRTKLSEKGIAQEELLRNQNVILNALHKTTFDLHSSLELDVVLKSVVERACELLDSKHGFLDLLQETGELEPVIGIGDFFQLNKYKVEKGKGIGGIVWKTGEPVVVPDYDDWPERIAKFPSGVIRSIVGVPLLLDNKVVGVIGVARGAESKAQYSEDHVLSLRKFADLALIAFQNATLFKKAQNEIKVRTRTEMELRNTNQLLQLQIERIEVLQEKLQELAIKDPLTELYNRRYLQKAMDLEFSNPKRSDKPTAVLMMDSDNLKGINDNFGHKAGDDFLVIIAKEIRKNIRHGDIACRYGGDEFVVVMNNVTGKSAHKKAENLRQNILEQNIVHRNENVNISVSIGIAIFPKHGSTAEELLIKADKALYKAKRMGKNQVVTLGVVQKQTS
ncbi:MAG: diguanylate cyclase [Anaerolineae bacterium]|nr:diguanylate cyclase [Anaerolineae bacterium]MDK1081755.1 diguanylate cyclase [Anaerolineae bacterium]MDK1118221.1 diguanylate cyclase [Anaerolineae bacterium]